MKRYIIGFFYNIFKKGVSLLSLVDYKSKISKKSKIFYGVKVFDSSIDDYSYIGPFSKIICSSIGKYCSISTDCTIGLGTHSLLNISTSPIFTNKKNGTGQSWTDNNHFQEFQKVTIGNDVWIGINVIVMGGINIGDGAIIGAGSIVTKDVPEYAIVAGIPAKIIKYRFDNDMINKLLELKWWNLDPNHLKEKIEIFQKENISINDLDNI